MTEACWVWVCNQVPNPSFSCSTKRRLWFSSSKGCCWQTTSRRNCRPQVGVCIRNRTSPTLDLSWNGAGLHYSKRKWQCYGPVRGVPWLFRTRSASRSSSQWWGSIWFGSSLLFKRLRFSDSPSLSACRRSSAWFQSAPVCSITTSLLTCADAQVRSLCWYSSRQCPIFYFPMKSWLRRRWAKSPCSDHPWTKTVSPLSSTPAPKASSGWSLWFLASKSVRSCF